MESSIFKAERDSLAFLGLLSHMDKTFDDQVLGPDKEQTHKNGLNIHALFVDNASGGILALKKNDIHTFNDPMRHAEQLALKTAIERKNELNPRNEKTTSVEGYYRNLLFNDPNSYDALRSGASIYTTLEPCPFCTSALLVSRMKRIVFITPDIAYGNSFYSLWSVYYKKYDVRYEQMKIESIPGNKVLETARVHLVVILKKISQMNDTAGTLFFDSLKEDLKRVRESFDSITSTDLRTAGTDLENNTKLLTELKATI